MGDGYTKENKLSKSAEAFINKSMFDVVMTLSKFQRRFIICGRKLRFKWFDIRDRVRLHMKVNEMDARESHPCSQSVTPGHYNMVIEVDVLWNDLRGTKEMFTLTT